MTGELTGSLVGASGNLWVVGKVTHVLSDGWDFIGVFSGEALALKAIDKVCTDLADSGKGSYFVAPAQLDKPQVCADGSDWKGGYFPFR